MSVLNFVTGEISYKTYLGYIPNHAHSLAYHQINGILFAFIKYSLAIKPNSRKFLDLFAFWFL